MRPGRYKIEIAVKDVQRTAKACGAGYRGSGVLRRQAVDLVADLADQMEAVPTKDVSRAVS